MAISHGAWQARIAAARDRIYENLAQHNEEQWRCEGQCAAQSESFDALTEPVIARLRVLGMRSSFACEGHWHSGSQSLGPLIIVIDVESEHMVVWRRFLSGFLCGDGGASKGISPQALRLANEISPRFLVGFVWDTIDDTEEAANQRRLGAISQLCAWLDDVGPMWL